MNSQGVNLVLVHIGIFIVINGVIRVVLASATNVDWKL